MKTVIALTALVAFVLVAVPAKAVYFETEDWREMYRCAQQNNCLTYRCGYFTGCQYCSAWEDSEQCVDYSKAYENARAVGRLGGPFCTAFLISQSKALTAAHCVITDDCENIVGSEVTLYMGMFRDRYDKDKVGPSKEYRCKFTEEWRDHDVAVLECEDAPGLEWGWLELAVGNTGVCGWREDYCVDMNDDELYVISVNEYDQDDLIEELGGGYSLKFSGDCRGLNTDSDKWFYKNEDLLGCKWTFKAFEHNCDTLGGSSGGPVINSNLNLVVGVVSEHWLGGFFEEQNWAGSVAHWMQLQPDGDEDGIRDVIDNCPGVPNSNQLDNDCGGKGDGRGNVCDVCPQDCDPDPDPDGDGFADACQDKCPGLWNPWQTDVDGDGQGDDCDRDIDGDGLLNPDDPSPFNAYLGFDADGDDVSDYYSRPRLRAEAFSPPSFCAFDLQATCASKCDEECGRVALIQPDLYASIAGRPLPTIMSFNESECKKQCATIDNCSYRHMAPYFGVNPNLYEAKCVVMEERAEDSFGRYYKVKVDKNCKKWFHNSGQENCDKELPGGDDIGDACDESPCVLGVGAVQVPGGGTSVVDGMAQITMWEKEATVTVKSSGHEFKNETDPDSFYKTGLSDDASLGECGCNFTDEGWCENRTGKGYCSHTYDFRTSGIRYYNPIYSSAVCGGIGDRADKKVSQSRYFNSKNVCAGKNFAFSKSIVPDLISGTKFKADWDWRTFPTIKEAKTATYSYSLAADGNIDLDVSRSPNVKQSQFRLIWERENPAPNVGDGRYRIHNARYGAWETFMWWERWTKPFPIGGWELPPFEPGYGADPVDNAGIDPGAIAGAIGGYCGGGYCMTGNTLRLVDPAEGSGVLGKYLVLYDPFAQSIRGVYQTSTASADYPSAELKDYGMTTARTSLAALGISADATQRGVVFVFGGRLDNVPPHMIPDQNDLYVGWVEGGELRWALMPKGGEEHPPGEVSGDIPPRSTKAPVAYDREANRLVVIDGIAKGVGPALAWAYDFSAGRWSFAPFFRAKQTGGPTFDFGYLHDTRHNRVFIFGGATTKGVVDYLLVGSLKTMEGENLSPKGGIGPRAKMAVYFDPERGKAILFGGIDEFDNPRNDLWEFDLDTFEWTKLADDTTQVVPTSGGTLAMDYSKGTLSYYGGTNSLPQAEQSKVWYFNLMVPKWTIYVKPPYVRILPGTPVSGVYTGGQAPVVEAQTPAVTAPTGQLTSIRLTQSTPALSLAVAEKNGVTVGRGVPQSPDEVVSFLGQSDKTYDVFIEPKVDVEPDAVYPFDLSMTPLVLPAAPAGQYKFPAIRDVAFVGNTVFAVGPKGLEIVDVSDAGNPRKLSSLFMFMPAEAIEVSGDYAFIANGILGLAVVDVSDLANPHVVAYEALMGYARDIEVRDGLAFVATGVFGVHMVDISDVENPQWIDTVCPKDVVTGIKAYGSLLLVNGLVKGLSIYDAADIENVVKLSSFKPGRKVEAMSALYDRIHLDEGKHGVEVVDITDPAAPVRVETYRDDDLAVAYKFSGLKAVKVTNKGFNVFVLTEQ